MSVTCDTSQFLIGPFRQFSLPKHSAIAFWSCPLDCGDSDEIANEVDVVVDVEVEAAVLGLVDVVLSHNTFDIDPDESRNMWPLSAFE